MATEDRDYIDELAEEDWTDPMNREDLLRFLKRCSPRTRSTVIRAIEGRASVDQVAYSRERIETMEPDATARVIEFLSSRTCEAGHVIDEKNRIVATAGCCGALTCEVQGCSLNCVRCGMSLCRQHASVYSDGEVYCRSCRQLKWLKIGLRGFGRCLRGLWQALRK